MTEAAARRVSLATLAVGIAVASALLVLTACNGEDADDWVTIHANRQPGPIGGALSECDLVQGLQITSLPECMAIEAGMVIGFANFYNERTTVDDGEANVGRAVKIRFGSDDVFGVDEVTLQYQETKTLEVRQTPAAFFQIQIEFLDGSGDHGGPVMVPVKPPAND